MEESNVAKAKKSAPNKPHSKPKPAKPAVAPLIDPAQSAAAAAAMVAHKVSVPTSQAPHAQSTTFQKLKDSLNKPHAQTMGGLLDKLSSPGQKKSAQPFGGSKQVGHNQTFGSDASRRNVPRRTGG
jgi:hypothetical protein